MTELGLVLGFLIVAVAAIVLFIQNSQSQIAKITRIQKFSIAADKDEKVILIGFPDRKGCTETYSMIGQRLPRIHMFILGLLTGTCCSAMTAKLILHRERPGSSVLWFFLWLIIVGLSWGIAFAMERMYVQKLLRRGILEHHVMNGNDPLMIAASLYFCSKRFTNWSVIAAFLGGAIITITDMEGLPVALIMLLAAGLVWWYSRDEKSQWLAPRDLEKSVLPVRESICDGGWVTPAGLLLCAASMGLLYFSHAQASLVMIVAVCGTALALWSERASRSEAHLHSIETWRLAIRDRLTAPAVTANNLPDLTS